jgi:hypothetical protein
MRLMRSVILADNVEVITEGKFATIYITFSNAFAPTYEEKKILFQVFNNVARLIMPLSTSLFIRLPTFTSHFSFTCLNFNYWHKLSVI